MEEDKALSTAGGRAAALVGDDYFTGLADRLDRPERIEAALEKGRKTVAVFGVRVPEALFRACGAESVYVGGLAASPDGIDLPRDACTICRTGLDLLANRWIPAGLIDAVVVAGGCDWMTRLGDRLSDHVPVWPLEVGRTEGAALGRPQDLRARAANLAKVVDALGRLTDLPFSRREFLKAFDLDASLDLLLRRLDRLRSSWPGAVRATEYYRIAGSLDLATPKRWIEAVEKFLESSENVRAGGAGDPRVILAGCPTGFPEGAIVDMIEDAGLQIVGDDFRLHARSTKGRPPSRGGKRAILRWLVDELVIGGLPEDAEQAGTLAELPAGREAAGIVWLTYRGCAPSSMDAVRLGRWKIPVLAVEAEKVSPAPEGLRTRLEAFRDQLLAAPVGSENAE